MSHHKTQHPLQGASVLVVDDDAASAERVADLVRDLGGHPHVANEWVGALRAFSSDSIDLVLMDAIMPRVDGFKLTKVLRQRSSSYVPIVFLTGLADASSREHGVACGADDFLTKPVDPVEFITRLTAMLRIRRLTQALMEKTRMLESMARIDDLTGLENRRSMEKAVPDELARAARYQHTLSLLLIDLDHFKHINDDYGHAAGDEVLALFGRILGERIRRNDGGFRYGGEEFVVLTPETALPAAQALAEDIRRRFSRATADQCTAGRQTLSVGIACTDVLGTAIGSQQLLAAADTALYRAKELGRDQVCIYDPRWDTRAA